VDFPNSNKAKKVFLVLLVGSGGQVPQGLQGDAEGVENEDKAKFERRRERAKARLGVKKKNIKDRDWVLKKKQVWVRCSFPFRELTNGSIVISYIDNEGKRTFLGTRNIPPGSGRFVSDLPGHMFVPTHPLIHYYVHYLGHEQPERGHRSTNSSLAALTASSGPFLMKVPWRAAMLTLLPSFISLSTTLSNSLPKVSRSTFCSES